MTKMIVTDLTRFQNGEIVCTAGTVLETGRCVRPIPYLETKTCESLNILPGAILSGKFVPKAGMTGPHREDVTATELRFEGPASSDQFEKALRAGLHESVEAGFEIKLAAGQKSVPVAHTVQRSIITLAVSPQSVQIVEDAYKPGKVKLHFVDGAGRAFQYLPITDLGFFRYADSHRAKSELASLNAFVQKQKKVYLRVGLARAWNNAFWMQVNGIYTFPEFHNDIRCYK